MNMYYLYNYLIHIHNFLINFIAFLKVNESFYNLNL